MCAKWSSWRRFARGGGVELVWCIRIIIYMYYIILYTYIYTYIYICMFCAVFLQQAVNTGLDLHWPVHSSEQVVSSTENNSVVGAELPSRCAQTGIQGMAELNPSALLRFSRRKKHMRVPSQNRATPFRRSEPAFV